MAIITSRAALTISRTAILSEVVAEREFQDRKHGPITAEGGHTLGEWLLIAESELNEAKTALIKGGTGRNSLRSEMIQVVATLFAALEQHGIVDPPNGERQI